MGQVVNKNEEQHYEWTGEKGQASATPFIIGVRNVIFERR